MRKLFVLLFAAFIVGSIYAIDNKEITIYNPAEKSVLGGTFSLPDDGEPAAVVVLATGSGQQDRDETVFGHKPFKTVAEYLAANGYAVIRLDDRGVGSSTGEVEKATTANFASDIKRAVEWADSVIPGVPAGVLGHSEGGQIAYRVAAQSPLCRFIITLAAPAWRGDSLVMSQNRALATMALGRWDGEKAQRNILDIALADFPASVAMPAIMAEISSTMGDAAKMPQVQEYVYKQASLVLTPWYREFIRFDPSATISAVNVPWLALNGDRDVQVSVDNLTTIKELCPSAKVVVMPGHNHLLQHCTTGLPNEYETIAEDISQETLSEILGFLNDCFKKH